MRRRRVLVVSYHFPPVGGAGVQRIAKFVRYLPEFGWDVSVLQAANPSVPLIDDSLLAGLPADLVVERARTFEPSYATKQTVGAPGSAARGGVGAAAKRSLRRAAAIALQPDAQVLWLPDAVRRGRRLLGRMSHDAILATAPSYTNLVVGAMLARHSGLPLLTDFRDEWDLSSTYWENAPKDGATLAVQRRLQRYVLRRSAAVVATTAASTARLAARATEAGATPLARCIYNGWDADDLRHAAEVAPAVPRRDGVFRLLYTGTLWNLTSIAPLADALTQLASTSPGLLRRLELVVMGRKTPEQQAQLTRMAALGCAPVDVPYAEHPVAVATMRSADALLLLLSDLPGVDRVAPAKAFEYFAAARPMLAILPDGETAGLVRSVEPGAHFVPADISGIAGWLAQRLSGNTVSRELAGADRTAAIARFERRALTGELAGVLDQLVAGRAA
ncbi:MAG TPA: hypothetical protein VHW65_08605 [Gemmatimonadales bacterium]|nr:hypothetical protein [Gemmatimonadales bacterium]